MKSDKGQNDTPYPLDSTVACMGIMGKHLHTHIGTHIHRVYAHIGTHIHIMHAHIQMNILME